jgi:hypothetical protein
MNILKIFQNKRSMELNIEAILNRVNIELLRTRNFIVDLSQSCCTV